MQVRVERELLVKAVHRTLGVVDRRGMMPILSHVLMVAIVVNLKRLVKLTLPAAPEPRVVFAA